MNTVTAPAPQAKKTLMMRRMNWLHFIAESLARFRHFDEEDVERAGSIKLGLEMWIKKHAPSGSGFDQGTQLDFDSCKKNRIVFTTAFHHMDEHGGYDGWTNHTVVVYPAFDGFDIRVTGRNRNDIKDYVQSTFHHWLNSGESHPALVEQLVD